MKRKIVYGILILALLVSLAGMACAKPAPTATPAPTPTQAVAATAAPAPATTVAPTPTAAPAKVYNWRWVMGLPKATHPWLDTYAADLEAKSGGRIKVTFLEPGAHPYAGLDFPKVIRDRLAEVVFNYGSYFSGVAPLLDATSLPWIQGTADLEERWDIFNKLRAEMFDPVLEQWNGIPLTIYIGVGAGYSGPKSFTTLEAMKGVKMRAFSKEQADMMVIMGFVPTVLSWADTYPALQRGLVEGVGVHVLSQYQSKFFEIVKYFTRANYYASITFMELNKAAFNELPADLQAIVMDIGKKYDDISQQQQIDDDARSTLKAMDEYGLNVATMSPALSLKIEGMMGPVWKAWADKVGVGGMETVQKVQQLHQEWMKTH